MFVLRARVRLDVGVLGAEQRLDAVDRQLLDLVHDLAAAVVALARVALGVLVVERRAHRLEHARPGEVLGGDQLDRVRWRSSSRSSQRGDVRVDLVQTGRSIEVKTLSRHRVLLSLAPRRRGHRS